MDQAEGTTDAKKCGKFLNGFITLLQRNSGKLVQDKIEGWAGTHDKGSIWHVEQCGLHYLMWMEEVV